MFLYKNHFAQVTNWQWANSATGSGAESVNCTITDANGNVFIAGYFYSPTISFGNYTLTNKGNYDVFITKYDAQGNLQWAKSAGGIYDDVGLGIAVDGGGNAYLTGYFYSPTLTMGTFTLNNAGAGNIFIAKYNASGNEVWVKNIGGTGDEAANSIFIDATGNLYITGFYSSASLLFDNDTILNTGANDVFVAKLNNLGSTLWVKTIYGTVNDVGSAITVDSNGEVVITGFFNSSTVVADSYSLTNTGSSDVFMIKYNAIGNVLWAKSFAGAYSDKGYGVAIDGLNNILITGTFFSPSISIQSFSITNNGNFDFFVAKFDAQGNAIWAKGEGGFGDDTGYGIYATASGDSYVTGHFHSPSITLGGNILTNTGIGDVYVVKYDAAGNTLWANGVGGTSDDGTSCITSDSNGNVVIAGYFISPNVVIGANTLVNTGNEDLFVAKFSDITTGTIKNWQENKGAFTIYPNPSNGEFYIMLDSFKIQSIIVYNELGEIVYDLRDNASPRILIDLVNKPSGIYYLEAKADQKVYHKKLVVD